MSWAALLQLSKQGDDVRLFEGVIASTPATVSEQVKVVIPAHDFDQPFGPAPWTPRPLAGGTVSMPSRGDRCVAALAETDDPGEPEVWILAWWPF